MRTNDTISKSPTQTTKIHLCSLVRTFADRISVLCFIMKTVGSAEVYENGSLHSLCCGRYGLSFFSPSTASKCTAKYMSLLLQTARKSLYLTSQELRAVNYPVVATRSVT